MIDGRSRTADLKATAGNWRAFAYTIGGLATIGSLALAADVAAGDGFRSRFDTPTFVTVFVSAMLGIAFSVGLYVLLASILEGVALVTESITALTRVASGSFVPSTLHDGVVSESQAADQWAGAGVQQPTRTQVSGEATADSLPPIDFTVGTVATVTPSGGTQAWTDLGQMRPVLLHDGTPAPLEEGLSVVVRGVQGRLVLVRPEGWAYDVWVSGEDISTE